MAEYPDSWAIEMQFTTSVWTDVTDDVVVADRVRFDRGIRDNSPTDRVASTGKMTLSLDNSTNNSAGLAGYYSPGHVNARSGFATGIPVRLRITYDGYTRTKFYGRIAKDGIKPSPGIYGSRRTEVTVVDWMNQAATHNIKLPEYTTNKRIDEIVPLIVANMPLAPLSTSYATGVDTFPSVFDSLGENTRAISELQKLALSEYSYIYLRCTDSSDEQLVVENRNSRSNYGTDLLSVPIVTSLSGHLLKEDGGDVLLDDGAHVTKSLLHLNGADDSTTITDEYGKAWTANGDAKLDTAQSKFGVSSVYFDGSGDYISTPDHDDFTVGAENFTLDFWVKRGGGLGNIQYLCGQANTALNEASRNINPRFNADNTVSAIVLSSTTYYTVAGTTVVNDTSNWHHLAVTRNAGTLSLFVDGNLDKTVTTIGTKEINNGTSEFAIGRAGAYTPLTLNGWVDEFRFVKGTAIWTANFTPPTAPYDNPDSSSILLDEVESADFTDAAINPEFSYGKHMVNVLTVTSYPRRYDDVAGTLFTLQSPVQIEASGSKTAYRCTYRDPTGGAWRVAGKNMVTPAATTHYLFNASNAGTGTDLTTNLAVTAAYGAEAVEYTLVNSGTVAGYVTKLEAVGEGIYLYDPVNYVAVNETSKTEHGSQELTISMTYQDDPETAEKVGALEVYNLSTPRYELDKYSFCANRDATNMLVFLKAEIGDRIHVTETQTGFDRDRYIDGIECEILPNKILMVTWRTRFVSSIDSWYVGVEGYSELGVTTYLG